MILFDNKKQLQNHLKSSLNSTITIGFIPTMGALHEGHMSLIKKAKKQNDIVICSIFVNPTQFNNIEDLKKYPSSLEQDLKLLRENSCDFVYYPTVEDVYMKNVKSKKYNFGGIEKEMEGAFRPGHFDGVATIVEFLLRAVRPHKAYFGEKDFQQLQIIRTLVDLKKLQTEIVSMPIHREKDGLAMSSRNRRLSSEFRAEAPIIFKILTEAKKIAQTEDLQTVLTFAQNAFQKSNLELEYFIITNENDLKTVEKLNKNQKQRIFVSAYASNIRLIDNINLW